MAELEDEISLIRDALRLTFKMLNFGDCVINFLCYCFHNLIKYHPRWMHLIGFVDLLDSGGRKVIGVDTKS